MAFYKNYFFKFNYRNPFNRNKQSWEKYCLERKCCTESTKEATEDLKAIYLSESMLFAWKYSISKDEDK